LHLEGVQSVLGALQARERRIEVVLVRSNAQRDRYSEVLSLAETQDIPVKYVSRQELEALTHGRSHGGLVAICSRKPVRRFDALQEILKYGPGPPLLLILEGVEDQQHLGYVLRTAEAFGVNAVLLKKHLWDFDETEVSRASSGAFERLPLIRFSQASDVRKFHRHNIRLWGCIARSKRTIYDVDFNSPVAVAVGGEKRGLSGALRQHCDGFVRIPMRPESSSSLSLTHAACLILGEVFRQRFQPDNFPVHK
jgi:23S rRNA (guanosine2251-2'-O)-methyltransferase